jgi:hypothetical protein
VNEYAERLRRERRTELFGLVLDLDRPMMMSSPSPRTPPMLGWERVYFVDGRD